jgi:hypothetical protein
MESKDFMGLMVGGNAEMGFEISDEENQSDEQGRNGEGFKTFAFHDGQTRGNGKGSQKKSKNIFRKGENEGFA